MDWISKIGDLRKGGLEALFLLLSALLFIDCFSNIFWNIPINNCFLTLTAFQIIILIASYLCFYYVIKSIRFLIVNLGTNMIMIKFFKTEKYKDYYEFDELLNDSLQENNIVKYNHYIKLSSEKEHRNNLRTVVFVTLVLSIIDSFIGSSIIKYISINEKIIFLLVVVGIILFIVGVQVDEFGSSSTFIRKKKFSLYE